jgi:transcriptional regulator with XRE-family HTH domain
MKAQEAKKIAKMLYVDMGLSQVEIAERLGKDKAQISRWAKDGNWKTLRSAATATVEQIVQRTYAQINLIYDKVEEDENGISSADTDKIAKLMASIKTLNRGSDLASYIQAYEEFVRFVREDDASLAKIIGDYQMEFLTQKSIKLSKE